MHRFFVPHLASHQGLVRLSGEAAHHASVRRLQEQEQVELFDGQGTIVRAEVISCSATETVLRILDSVESPDATRVVLIQALTKGDKLELITRMATEIGVQEIHLVVSERTIVRPEPSRTARKVDRLERIAREAATQCGRATVPKVHGPEALLSTAKRAPSGTTCLVCWEGSNRPLVAMDTKIWVKPVWLVIGPEGGLSIREIEDLAQCGFLDVSLGPSCLRVDTAAVVALGLVSAMCEMKRHIRNTNDS